MGSGAGGAIDGRRDQILLAGATLLAAAVVLVAAWQVPGPSVVWDEAGYLGNARWLTGDHRWAMPVAPSYSIGYPLVLAPVVALVGDPDLQWRAVLVVNAVLLASLVPLLTAVLHRLGGVPRRRALLAAAVGTAVPAVLAAGASAIAENLVLPLVPASVLAGAAMADPHASPRSRWWFGAAAGALSATHPRFVPALAVAAAVVALAAWQAPSRRDRIVAAVNGVALVAVAGAGRLLTDRVVSARWAGVEQLEGDLSTWTDLLTSGQGLGEVARTALGQGWYLAAGSLGLALIGVVVVAGRLRPGAPMPTRVAAGWVLGAAGAVFATSVLFFAQNQFRLDHYVYGRHNDSFTPLWVAAAVAWLAGVPAARRWRPVLASLLPVAAAGALLVAVRDEEALGRAFSPFAAPAVARAASIDPLQLFAVGTVAALVLGALATAALATSRLGVVARRAPAVPAAVALGIVVGWFAYGSAAAVSGTADFATVERAHWEAPADVERLGIDELAIDASAVAGRPVLTYPFALPHVAFTTYDGAAGEQPAGPFALASVADGARRAAGDRIVLLDQGGLYPEYGGDAGLAVWVAPGPEQDALAERGALVADDPAAPVAPRDRRAGIRIVDPPAAPVEVAPEGRVPLTVALEHRGATAPWPDRYSWGLPGYVRVVALIEPLDPDGVVGARSGGELGRWMLPGDQREIDVEVVAIGDFFVPLPEGRYRVELALIQEGADWTTPGGPAATFELEVTEG